MSRFKLKNYKTNKDNEKFENWKQLCADNVTKHNCIINNPKKMQILSKMIDEEASNTEIK